MRAEQARSVRHAATLRRFWQARPGLVWQDAAAAALFMAGVAGLAWVWRQGAPEARGLQPQQPAAVADAAVSVVPAAAGGG
jgi:hypothetical protein